MSVSDDAFLGGGLRIFQPLQGYRAGLDAVFLASAVVDRPGLGARVLDVGAGVGTAGLCVAWRCAGARVVLIEREPDLVALARQNIARNGLENRVSVIEADVGRISRDELAAHGIVEEHFDHVIANPPFHSEGAGTAARHALKAAAHAMPEAGLADWARFMARMARPGGEALVIHKADALPALLSCFEGRFGGLSVQPLHPQMGEAANRVIVRGTKGSRAPFRIEAGLVLHDAEKRATAGADGVLRRGLALDAAFGAAKRETVTGG
ncbi:tRNA1(Val) (adenine(37)-N6)-methyltransferase [Hyphomicrobium sp.]|uniref:tRNA1(Val) (adenine(37)-N6)-methyltransferase n=1 Tax=Hyphomicrobium sp. TaxID=82 RepID=UPI003F729808